jgi:hypothetical protein
MAVVSFKREVVLCAAMGAIQMATLSLLMQPEDPCIFYDDASIV